jgi:AI-2 transport protein TqsA
VGAFRGMVLAKGFMNDGTMRLVRVSLAVILGVTVVAVMRWTSVITVPVGLAVFILILAWPLQRMLEQHRVPRWLAYILTLLTIFVVCLAFVGILYLCFRNVAEGATDYGNRIAQLIERIPFLSDWAEENANNSESPLNQFGEKLLTAIQALFAGVYALVGLLTLTVTFTFLGLLETHAFLDTLARRVNREISAMVLEVGQEVSTVIQRYMLARTLVSLTTGLLVGLYTWAIGLDFPLVWGITTFLLNYVPMLGSIVAVIPPTIVGFLQPELWMGFATLGGLTLIQFSIGYYVDPLVEGRILAISPFVLLFSILFWGWVWGIPGALLGIPITASLVIIFAKFEGLRWIAELVQRPKD